MCSYWNRWNLGFVQASNQVTLKVPSPEPPLGVACLVYNLLAMAEYRSWQPRLPRLLLWVTFPFKQQRVPVSGSETENCSCHLGIGKEMFLC